MFKRIIFWSEFPDRVNWKKVKKLIDFKTEIYVACKTRKEFEKWEKKINSKNIEVGAWPVLEKEDGYWFSGFTSKKNIDKLKEFKGLKIKVDIEPPIPKKEYTFSLVFFWLIKYIFLKKPKNNKYLKEVIKKLSKNTYIISSGFPFPEFITKRYGDDLEIEGNIKKNYMAYSTFIPKPLMPLAVFFFSIFIKKALKKYKDRLMIALGCIGPGIFKTEPTYKGIEEFRKDLERAKMLGVKNIVIFRIDAILKRKKPEEWVKVLKEFTS